MNRRTFLISAGGGATIAFAGCIGGAGDQSTIPQIEFQWDPTYTPESSLLPVDHQNASFVELTHMGGDQPPTDTLTLSGDNLAYPDGSSAISSAVSVPAGSTTTFGSTFAEGDSFRVNLDESGEPRAFSLALTWESPTEPDSSVIFEVRGSRA